MTLEQQLQQLQETSTSVTQDEQEIWADASKMSIEDGDVEQLSVKGLLQVVDLLSYHIITESQRGIEMNLTDEEFLELEESMLPEQNEIIRVAALASGVHPEIVNEMIDIRCDFYTELYCNSRF